MKRSKKKYKRPKKPFDKERIEREKEILKNYGLKKKQEIWKAETLLRKYRRLARRLAASKDKKMEKELIEKLARLGILNKNAGLDDVLGLTVEDILNRRLQTIVFKKGFANTPKQARQFIVHGHVFIGDRKVSYPSYLVAGDEENSVRVSLPNKAETAAKPSKTGEENGKG